jgi:dipeptidase E
MKLILASDYTFLIKYGYNLTGIPKDQMKIGYINTAIQVESDKDKDFMNRAKNTIKENGYYFDEINIDGKSEKELKDFFKDKNIIHIDGGNTFYLLKAIRETGFADILKELLDEGRVYIGTSAGAYVVCPTIEVSAWNPDNKRFGLDDFTALNYVPFVLRVHYKEKYEELVKENLKTLKYPLHILRDGQGMFCENGTCRFIGDEEEVKIEF